MQQQKKKKKTRVSIHAVKRRLMRMLYASHSADVIVREIRARGCALAFARGRALDNILADNDLAGGWDRDELESEIRKQITVKS